MTPRVCVVIPTHNRHARLTRTIDAIVGQHYPLDAVELIVVADGCSDGTEKLTIPPPLAGRVVTQPHRGPAAARNRGAAEASGDLLLFIDDDVDASPELIAAHARAQARSTAPTVVVGYLPPRLEGRRDSFGIALRGWWLAMFERMREAGHRFTYADVLTGNCSVPRSFFNALGGFDESLRCHEDYELGFRVLRAGGRIAFEPAAAGSHDERTRLGGALERKRHEGAADVAFARKHPDISSALPFATRERRLSRRNRLSRALALRHPIVGDVVAHTARLALTVLAWSRARRQWRRLLENVLWYWYWRGVGDVLGDAGFDELRGLIEAGHASKGELPELDLRPGLAAAAHTLDRLSPAGIILRYGTVHVGVTREQPWAEPLAGRHLRRLLKTQFADALGEAIAVTKAFESEGAPTLDAIRVVMSSAVAEFDDGRV